MRLRLRAVQLYVRIFPVNTMLKSLFVWLMLLAMPFQGFAAATQLLCAPPAGPAVHLAAANDRAPHEHVSMLVAQSAEHDHHVTTTDASRSHTDDGSSVDHHAEGQCGTCLACCFVVSMAPSSSSDMPVQELHSEAVPFGSGLYQTVDLALPERPPQSSLA